MNGLSMSAISWRGSTGVTIISTISPGVERNATFTKARTDPETGDRVDLYNPRQDSWERHFTIDVSGHIIGLTPTGRATVRLLDMNGIPQLDLRQTLIAGGEFDL
jgi:hypothetical protein